MTVIGITGTDGAGKGTVVDYLVTKYGFVHYSSRAVIAEVASARELPLTRNQLRLVANELREQYGNDYVVRTSYEKAVAAGDTRIIIESIRAIAEANFIKSVDGILLAVDADQALRFKRVQQRRASTDHVTLAEFQAHEALEAREANPHGMQKAAVLTMADYTILNNGSLGELYQAVDRWMEKVSIGR